MLSINEINFLQAQNEGLKKQNAELQKENAELKAYKDVNEDFKTAWGELKAENELLKEENYQLQKDCQICENFIDFIPCKPIRDMDYDLQKVINQRDKYIQTLQEIKKYIAKICKEECGYVQKKRCLDCDCRFGAILDQI